MKHLRKKFVKAEFVNDEIVNTLDSAPVDEDAIMELRKTEFDGYYATIMTNENALIQAFKYKNDKTGKISFIPEPDPIVIYFEIGRFFLNDISAKRKLLMDELALENPDARKVLGFTFAYFQVASISITFLFNALEAFINKIIPKDYLYKVESNRKTEIYDKIQIQRYLRFDDKIKKVIPEITGKSFHSDFSHKWESLKKLKEFRDEIMHTKSFDQDSPNMYEILYNTSLNFDYLKGQEAAKDFINFYEENLIEECECGREN